MLLRTKHCHHVFILIAYELFTPYNLSMISCKGVQYCFSNAYAMQTIQILTNIYFKMTHFLLFNVLESSIHQNII